MATDPLKLIHSSISNRPCSGSSRIRCGSMSCIRGQSSLWRGRVRACPTGWIVISGMVWCAASAQLVNSLEYLQPMWTSAASMPEWTKPQLALAVWAVCCPARTLDRFKFTSAWLLLGCWRSFFSTHGWLSHGDYFDSVARRGGRMHLAAAEWPPDRADV